MISLFTFTACFLNYTTSVLLLFSCFPDYPECLLDHHGCQHICNNLQGSFYCSCYTGYALNMDNKTCAGKRYSEACFVMMSHSLQQLIIACRSFLYIQVFLLPSVLVFGFSRKTQCAQVSHPQIFTSEQLFPF